MKKLALALAGLLAAMATTADANDLGRFVGYTIVAKMTIVGYRDRNGKSGDSFEGCDFDRIIIFEDNRVLKCTSYSYQYSYRPTAMILSNGSSFKMVVERDVYDMSR